MKPVSRREWVTQGLFVSGALGVSAAEVNREVKRKEPPDWTLVEASHVLARRQISSEELTKICLAKIRAEDAAVNSFISVTEQLAIYDARESDRRRRSGNVGLLDGIPLALKDNIDTAGIRTTAGSRVYETRVPNEDAEVAGRLKAAGMVLLGKLNLDEFAFEGTGTTGFTGPVRNPWNHDRITGGSSAGSAAALAAKFCYGSVGSDDGGSVRIPASYCGVVGLKTSYGRVSTRGVVPSAYSLDTMGPMARSVEDVAALLHAVAGFDERDSIVAQAPVPDYLAALAAPVRTLRLGVARGYFFEDIDPAVAEAVEAAIALLAKHVASVKDMSLPQFSFVADGSYDVELLHYHAPLLENYGNLYHPWSRRQLAGLRGVTAVNYVETLKRIREARRQIREVFETVDLLVLPTMRETAPPIAETVNETHHRKPSNVAAFNRFGVPALTLPCGATSEGMPIGLQIVGPVFAEDRVLRLGYAYQQARMGLR